MLPPLTPPSSPTPSPGSRQQSTPRELRPDVTSWISSNSPRAGRVMQSTDQADKCPSWRSPTLHERGCTPSAAFLTALQKPLPQEYHSFSGPSQCDAHSANQIRLPPYLTDDPHFNRLYTLLQNHDKRQQAALPTTRPGDVFADELDADHRIFTLPKNHTVACVAMRKVQGTRHSRFEPRRLCAILRAMLEYKAIPPIEVNEQLHIQNGFHRFFASQLAGYTEIDVALPLQSSQRQRD